MSVRGDFVLPAPLRLWTELQILSNVFCCQCVLMHVLHGWRSCWR